MIFSALAQSRRHDNTEVSEKCNGCNSLSLGDHGVPEGDRIPSLKSHRKTLEQESGFRGVFCDCSDASADLLRQLYRHLVPHIIIIICARRQIIQESCIVKHLTINDINQWAMAVNNSDSRYRQTYLHHLQLAGVSQITTGGVIVEYLLSYVDVGTKH